MRRAKQEPVILLVWCPQRAGCSPRIEKQRVARTAFIAAGTSPIGAFGPVDVDGNGILVKKNSSGEPWSYRAGLPIAKPTASAPCVPREAELLATSNIGETRRAAVEHASGFAPPHAARLSPVRQRHRSMRAWASRALDARPVQRRYLKPCSHAPMRLAALVGHSEPFQAILPAIIPAPACC